jgi:hypothetical protein
MTVDEAKQRLGMRFDSQLADFLKVRGSTVWAYRARGAIPRPREDQVELEASLRKDAAEALAS